MAWFFFFWAIYEKVKHVKMFLPAIFMFGVVPHYFIVWIAWRFLSFMLPSSVYQSGDDMYYSMYQRLILFFFENVTGIKLYLLGDCERALKKKEKVVYLSNHQSTVDWVIVHMLAERQNSCGHVRYIMKDSLQLIPLYGFYFYEHGCVFVKRNFFNSRKMINSLKYLQNRKIYNWMVIFPEGTRYNPEATSLIEKSQNFAKERGLVPFNHVLTPKYKGLFLTLTNLKDNLDAVYDATVIYSCTKGNKKTLRTKAPSMFDFLTGCCDSVYFHLNRIDIHDVPSDETEFKLWLHDLFLKKERFLTDYYSDNPPPSLLSGIRPSPSCFLRNTTAFVFFLSITAPIVMTSFGRSLYWKSCLFGSIFGYFWLGVRSVS